MPETENNSFMSIEEELTRLVSHLETLKQEVEQYQSAAQQLNSGREALVSVGERVSNHGERMAAAGDQAAAAMTSAVQSLKPLGTTEIKADLQSMQDHLSKTAADIEGHFGAVQSAATQIAESAAATQSMPATITDAVTEALTTQGDQIAKLLADADDRVTKQTDALAAKVDGLEAQLKQVERESKSQTEKLLDAVEHSAPIGLFRKKRDK